MSYFKELSKASVNYNRDSEFLAIHKLKPIVSEKKNEPRKRKYIDITNTSPSLSLTSSTDVMEDLSSSSSSTSTSGVLKKGRVYFQPKFIQEVKTTMSMEYDEEQISAVLAALTGKNVFLTGGPGVGKTHTIKALSDALKNNEVNHILLAPDPSTAIRLKTSTVDVWLNVASIYQQLDVLMKKIKKEKEKWASIKMMIIDNIGMLDADYLVKINQILCHVKKNSLPFGGIVLFVAGDLAQMPSIRAFKEQAKLFFKNAIWQHAQFQTFYLTTNYRHANDPVLSGLLDRIRLGRVTDDDRRLCESFKKPRRVRDIFPQLENIKTQYASIPWGKPGVNTPGIAPPSITTPRLHYVRNKCDEDNEKALKNIQPKRDLTVTFKVKEIYSESHKSMKEKANSWLQVMRTGPAKESLTLATGAQVILIEDLINPTIAPMSIDNADKKEEVVANANFPKITLIERGTTGIILGWSEDIISEIDGNSVRYPIIQFSGGVPPPNPPAISGQLSGSVSGSISGTNGESNGESKYGEEKRGGESNVVKEIDEKGSDKNDQNNQNDQKDQKGGGKGNVVPLVPPIIVKHFKWEDDATSTIYAQLPLAHGWAITIQDNCELSVDSVFMKTKGMIFDARQFYCCLSKVKNISGFSMEAFEPAWLNVDPIICEYYNQLGLEKDRVAKNLSSTSQKSTISESETYSEGKTEAKMTE